jgi:hypothetical protein
LPPVGTRIGLDIGRSNGELETVLVVVVGIEKDGKEVDVLA